MTNGDLVSGSCDRTLKIWRDGQCVNTLMGHTSWILSLILLPNGDLASGSSDDIKIWRNGQCLKTLNGHFGRVTALVVLSNENLVSGSGYETIKIWT